MNTETVQQVQGYSAFVATETNVKKEKKRNVSEPIGLFASYLVRDALMICPPSSMRSSPITIRIDQSEGQAFIHIDLLCAA